MSQEEDISFDGESNEDSQIQQKVDSISDEVPEHFLEEQSLYKKVTCDSNEEQKLKNHLQVKKTTEVQKCIAFAIDLMIYKTYPHVILFAISQNMDKAVFIAELLKRKIKGLHQINALNTYKYYDIYKPREPAEHRHIFKKEKFATRLEITIFRSAPKDIKKYGYQEPIQINLVSPRDPREYIQFVLKQNKEPKKKALMSKAREQIEHKQKYEQRNNEQYSQYPQRQYKKGYEQRQPYHQQGQQEGYQGKYQQQSYNANRNYHNRDHQYQPQQQHNQKTFYSNSNQESRQIHQNKNYHPKEHFQQKEQKHDVNQWTEEEDNDVEQHKPQQYKYQNKPYQKESYHYTERIQGNDYPHVQNKKQYHIKQEGNYIKIKEGNYNKKEEGNYNKKEQQQSYQPRGYYEKQSYPKYKQNYNKQRFEQVEYKKKDEEFEYVKKNQLLLYY